MKEREPRFDPDTGEPKKREAEEVSHEAVEEAARREAAMAESIARDAAESAARVKEIQEKLSKEEAKAKAAFEAEEAKAKAYVTGEVPPDMKARADRIEGLRGYLKEVKGAYKKKTDRIAKWQKAHPFLALGAVPASWPPRIMTWALEKADNIADGWLHKIEGWGDKKAPEWFKWMVDWSLWPIEGWAGLGRQTKPQADERAKEKREDKKEAEKLKKGK